MAGDQLVVCRLPEIEAINDKMGKPGGIVRQIGKSPIFVAGNFGCGGEMIRRAFMSRPIAMKRMRIDGEETKNKKQDWNNPACSSFLRR